MDENNESGSSSNKHQNEILEPSNRHKQDNSDLEGTTTTIDDQNEHLHAIITDEIPLNRAKIVAHASVTSSSSSSCLADVDYGEKDAVSVPSSSEENCSRADAEDAVNVPSSSEENCSRADAEDAVNVPSSSEENCSRADAEDAVNVPSSSEENCSRADAEDSVNVPSSSEENCSRADAESSAEASSSSPQWSMVSESPIKGPVINQESSLSPEISPQNSGLNVVSTSPMQSPVVQVMRRTGSYDPNRIPSSTFAENPTNSTDWTTTSNESLFSLHNGKSGELNKADFSSGLPTVIEATSEIDQKSVNGEAGEKENIEIENAAPIVSVNEDGNVVDSASPVVEDATSTKSDSKTTPPPPSTPPPPEGATEATQKTGGRKCFNCFSCCASRG